MAEIRSRVLAPAVATATREARSGPIAFLDGADADEAMKSKPTRRVPVMMSGPHEAAPPFHEDWTRVAGSESDPEKLELELRLRDTRNRMIRESLEEGRAVFYRSSGSSMWPLVQSDDACLFDPIQAVTAKDGIHSFQKKASEICVGDTRRFSRAPRTRRRLGGSRGFGWEHCQEWEWDPSLSLP